MEIFSKILEINYNLIFTSIFISITGVILGLLFYWLSTLKRNIINFLIIGIPAFILLLILFTYFIAGVDSVVDLFILFLKIIIIFIMCIVPMAAVYGIIKKQNSLFLVSSAGILFFFFLMISLSKIENELLLPIFSENQVVILILFFVLFLCFFEIGTSSIFFGSALDKMMSYSENGKDLFFRLNRVTNGYILNISFMFFLSFIISIFVVWIIDYNQFFNINEILNIDFSSVYGVIILTIITLTGAIFFWYLLPREKYKSQENP